MKYFLKFKVLWKSWSCHTTFSLDFYRWIGQFYASWCVVLLAPDEYQGDGCVVDDAYFSILFWKISRFAGVQRQRFRFPNSLFCFFFVLVFFTFSPAWGKLVIGLVATARQRRWITLTGVFAVFGLWSCGNTDAALPLRVTLRHSQTDSIFTLNTRGQFLFFFFSKMFSAWRDIQWLTNGCVLLYFTSHIPPLPLLHWCLCATIFDTVAAALCQTTEARDLMDSGGWHQLTAAWFLSAASLCTFLPRSGPDVLRGVGSCANTLGEGRFARKCNVASLQPLSCRTERR